MGSVMCSFQDRRRLSMKVAPAETIEAEESTMFLDPTCRKTAVSRCNNLIVVKRSRKLNETFKTWCLYFAEEARINFSFGFDHFMIAITLFVLFGDGVRILVFDKPADPVFEVGITVSFFVFTFELSILSWSKKGYFGSFFFWLDFIASISLIPQMPWMFVGMEWHSQIYNYNSIGAAGKLGRVGRMVRLVRIVKLYKVGSDISQAQHKSLLDNTIEVGGIMNLKNDLILLKTGHISLNEFVNRQKKLNHNTTVEPKSKLGTRLITATVRNVIVLVLVMLICISVVNQPFITGSPEFGRSDSLRLIQIFNKNHDSWNLIASINEARLFLDSSTPYITTLVQPNLVYLEIFPSYPNFTDFGCYESTPTWTAKKGFSASQASICVHNKNWIGGGSPGTKKEVRIINDVSKSKQALLRPSEIIGEEGDQGVDGGIKYSSNCCIETAGSSNLTCTKHGPCYIRYKFNVKVQMRDEAALDIFTNLFITFMLVLGSMTFIHDTHRKVLDPVREITDMVKKIADDPSSSFENIEEDIKREGGLEFTLVRNAIKKIIELLKISFGEAGFEMIRENLSLVANHQDANKPFAVDLSNPGTPILAVFGFFIIEDFDFLTQKLGGEIIDFVNTIAAIVHENVEQWGGHCNKNLGGSFLMTWKVPEIDYEHERETAMSLDMSRIPHVSERADSALIGTVKVIAELRRNKIIYAYEQREELQILGKPFRVRLRVGLHAGWAIEGPVGSMEKIDATYLSPHVNIAARCGTAAKQWHVDNLCSHVFTSCLSKEAQNIMRHIDRVCVKGSNASIDMFTFDTLLDQTMAPAATKSGKTKDIWKKFLKQDCSSELYILNRHIAFVPPESIDVDKKENFDYHKYAKKLINNTDEFEESILGELAEFNIKFHHHKGVQKYLEGNWMASIEILTVVDRVVAERVREYCHRDDKAAHIVNDGIVGDGPSRTLIEFMVQLGSKPPSHWCPTIGRKLHSK